MRQAGGFAPLRAAVLDAAISAPVRELTGLLEELGARWWAWDTQQASLGLRTDVSLDRQALSLGARGRAPHMALSPGMLCCRLSTGQASSASLEGASRVASRVELVRASVRPAACTSKMGAAGLLNSPAWHPACRDAADLRSCQAWRPC